MATTRKTPAKAKKTSPKKKTTGRAKPKKESVEATPDQKATPDSYVVRNKTGLEYNFRLDRQSEEKRRIELKPRGQRGDFKPLREGDLNDPVLQAQIDLGFVEVITTTEAAKVAKKQLTNAQRVHPAIAMLRNELGEEYAEGAISVEPSFEEQGVVVAELHDGQVAIDRTGIVRPGNEPIPDRRSRLRRPGDRPTSSPMVTQSRPGDVVAAEVDAKARKKTLQGPDAGIGDGVKVTVAPTQRT